VDELEEGAVAARRPPHPNPPLQEGREEESEDGAGAARSPPQPNPPPQGGREEETEEGAVAARCPPHPNPPPQGGREEESEDEAGAARCLPHPNPPPQGGREEESEDAAGAARSPLHPNLPPRGGREEESREASERVSGPFPIPARRVAHGPRATRLPVRRRPEQGESVVEPAGRHASRRGAAGLARGSARTRGRRRRSGTATEAPEARDVAPGSAWRAEPEPPAPSAGWERSPPAADCRPIATVPPSDALPDASGASSRAGLAGPSSGSLPRLRSRTPRCASMHLPASWDRLLPEANLSDGTLTHVRRTDRCPRPASGCRSLPTRWPRSRPRKARRSSAPWRID